MEEKPFQPNVFNKAQWKIIPCKILKKLFLARVYLYIYICGVPFLKKSEMEATCNFFLFLAV